MKNRTQSVFILALLEIFQSSSALDFKAVIHREGQKDNRQYCGTDLVIDQNGNWTATTQFSNGKKIDGDHFVAVMILYSNAGIALASIKHGAGVDASFTGRAREKRISSSGKIDPALANQISDKKTTYSCGGENVVDDKKLPGIVLGIIKDW